MIYTYFGSSMKGTFIPGDFLNIKKVHLNDLSKGDVIAFHKSIENLENIQVVHRIIRVLKGQIITIGDNSKRPDVQPVTNLNLIGKVEKLERSGKIHKVRGGLPGFFLARSKYCFRRCVFWVYTNICKLSIVKSSGKILLKKICPNIQKIKLLSSNDTITKWILKGKVIAQKGPDKDYFFCKKPFDLILKK